MDGVKASRLDRLAAGLAALSSETARQAAMIGYINAFYLIAFTGFAALPMLLLVRWPKAGAR